MEKKAKFVAEKCPFHVDFMKFMKSTCLAVTATFRRYKINESLKKPIKALKLIANMAEQLQRHFLVILKTK